MSETVPIVSGERIYLRLPNASDIKSIYDQICDPRVNQYLLVPSPYRERDAEKFVKSARNSFMNRTSYHFSVFLCQNHELIGGIGLTMMPHYPNVAELGYWLGLKHWGKGFAMEAVQLMMRYAFEVLNVVRIWAGTVLANTPSQNLLRKAGFSQEGQFRRRTKRRQRWDDELMWVLLRENWKPPIR